ncbi:MAG TPA: M1 family metallopeptidase [Methanoregulaceae archaeon]|nr:M1 family metallopeptidase [Methanoregulaceae archaeon]
MQLYPDRTMPRLFRYYPSDFNLPPVKVIHMDLAFDMYDDHTVARSRLTARTRDQSISTLNLNAKDLEIVSVSADSGPVACEYNQKSALLNITFPTPVPPDTEFSLSTETICRPTHNILEGLYYDVTPDGAPPQQITQCQQWGFQKLVPCFDDMTAKCTYVTTITADERYTHLISNGDIDEPWHRVGNGRAAIRYRNVSTPMAPYLFFLGAGTWTGFSRMLEYPDGRTISLELLLQPGTGSPGAEEALEILAGAVLWVYLFTGPACYEHVLVRQRLYALSMQLYRENRIGNDQAKTDKLRSEMRELLPLIVTGYQYTGTVYREIAMQNSDFGGMENVGNTTITANRIIPYTHISDRAYEYMIGVKVHEFYHNLNGSEVTGMTPFELWLNEAVTALIETRYLSFLSGEAYTRLSTVLDLLAPSGGTLALDAGAASMPIEPEGFNDPNDLITSITYVKGPEFVRMIETLVGPKNFVKGLDAYHTRYRHANATWQQWIQAMENISGIDLLEMASTWLHQKHYPDIRVRDHYSPDTRTLTLFLSQSGYGQGKPWTYPFRVALVDGEGRDIVERTFRVSGKEEEFTIADVEKPCFISINRGYSCYGKALHETDDGSLYLQAGKDPDTTGRFIAFYQLADIEKMKILESGITAPSDRFMDLVLSLIRDEELMATAGGQFLTIFEGTEDIRFAHHYTDLYQARRKIFSALGDKYREELIDVFNKYSADPADSSLQTRLSEIKRRQVKNTVLAILATLDVPFIHDIIRHQLISSPHQTDRLAAFSAYLNSTAPDRKEIFASFMAESQLHPVTWESFLSIVGSASSPDIVELMKLAETSGSFHAEQTTNQRGLYGSFALNRKMSLETPEGREYFLDILTRLARINEFTTIGLLRTFAAIDLMHVEYRVPLVGVLVSLMQAGDPEQSPAVRNTVRRILLGSPLALASYEKQFGPVSGIGD